MLTGSAMFGATLNLVTSAGGRTTVIFGTLKDGSHKLNSLEFVTINLTKDEIAYNSSGSDFYK